MVPQVNFIQNCQYNTHPPKEITTLLNFLIDIYINTKKKISNARIAKSIILSIHDLLHQLLEK